MTSVKKASVLCAWVATLGAAFLGARLIGPPDSAPAPGDFRAAVRAALAEKDAFERAAQTTAVLRYLGPENVDEAAAVYDRLLNLLGESDVRAFALAWARFDPAAALDHTVGWRYPKQQKIGASAAIEGWAMRDPAGARRAYEETSADEPRISEELFPKLLAGWVYSGDAGLVEYIAQLDGHKRDLAIARVVGAIMLTGDADAVKAWVGSIVGNDAYEKRFQRLVFRRGVRVVGRSDPEVAAAWTLEHLDREYAVDAPRIAAGRWSWKNGPAAMNWVRDLPLAELPDLAVREAFLGWYRSDRAAAVAWLESEKWTAFHDPAIAYYANDLSKREPEQAVAWCERILDSDTRLSCLKPAAAKWYEKDPAAAESWLERSVLDEEARSAVRTPPRSRKPPRRRRPGPPSFDVEVEVDAVPTSRTPD